MKHFTLSKRATVLKLLLMLFLYFPISLLAQTGNGASIPNFAPKSPEAAAFLKYGEYPVDLATGVPSISIPLYTVDIKGFKLPISLDYHASGIKVNQEATWVGLGWNLNAGAQVVLSPRDDIDENNPDVDVIPEDDEIINYYKLHPFKHNGGSIFPTNLDKSRVKDMYVFSSPTVNGSFYIKNFEKNEVVTIPPNAFKVYLLGGNRENMGFKITDPQGNVYSLNTTEISVRTDTHDDRYISAWYVDEIETPSNDKIDFTYEADGGISDENFTQRVELKRNSVTNGTTCSLVSVTGQISDIIEDKGATITLSKKIKEILFNDGTSRVLFTKTAGRKDLVNANSYLNKMEVQQLEFDGFLSVKGFVFEYSYFNESASSYLDKRLKLNRILNLYGIEEQKFVYSDILVPSKKSKGQDYFGYYNGADTNIDLIPKHYLSYPFPSEVGRANRSVSSSAIEAGILKEIHYPTKGWTKFNYENNQFYGVDIFSKYIPPIVSSNIIQGTGGSVEVKEVPDRDDGMVCANVNPDDCVNYVTIPFEAINANGQILFVMQNLGANDPTSSYRKHSYARVRVFAGSSTVYDSGRLNMSIKDVNESLNLPESGYIFIEVYGQETSIRNLQLKYVNNDQTPKNNMGAGLRIKSIENYTYDAITPVLKKEYDYSDVDNPEQTSGKLINELSASYTTSTFTNYNFHTCAPADSGITGCFSGVDRSSVYSISSNSRYGIEGNSVIYKYVKEKQIDPLNKKNNGYTQFEFTVAGDEIPFENPAVQISTTWKRGKIKSKKVYRTGGSVPLILEEENNLYVEDPANVSIYNGFKMFRIAKTNAMENSADPLTPMCPYDVDGGIEVLNTIEPITYNLRFLWYYQKESEKTSYFYDSSNNLTGKVVTSTNFNYNPVHLQLSSQTVKNSKGEILESKYFYAGDPEMASKPFVNELKSAYLIGVPLSTQTFKGGVKISEQLTNYDKSSSTNNLLLPKFLYANKGTADIDLNLDKKITYDLYDDRGNILQYTQEGGLPVSIIWGYNKTQPIAKIENIAYSSISPETITNLQTLSNSDSDNCMSADCSEQVLRNALNSFRNSFSATFISTYTYNPLVGVTSVTDPKGFSSYYEYDRDGRLRFVKDKDLNVLQKYCYNYKGQTTDCDDNSSTSVVLYKSVAKSGSFSKNNCSAGASSSSIVFSLRAGAVTSTISQADADALGQVKFNTDGQNYANINGYCTYYSVAQSGSFTRNNCVAGGSGETVFYNQSAGVVTSNVSQDDANALGYSKFIADGQANANEKGACTFYSIAINGSSTKKNCPAGGSGAAIYYSQPAGVMTSTVSQADADALGLAKFYVDAQANANVNGYCTFYSAPLSGSFSKNNCAYGGIGSSITYNQEFGASMSTNSQAEADALGLAKFNMDGQTYANSNGYCTYYSTAQSGSFMKSNCPSGGFGSTVAYSQAAGFMTSTTSQADADALGLYFFNANGQSYADANGYCTFYSAPQNGSFTKNDCLPGGMGSSVGYTQNWGEVSSIVSQTEANSLGWTKFNADGQAYANGNGYCTYYSAPFSGTFTKNDCNHGGVGSSLAFSQAAGVQTSRVSQAEADALGYSKFIADGQVYVNSNGGCTYSNAAISQTFTKNDCPANSTPGSYTYTVAAGKYTGGTQIKADGLAQNEINENGQYFANMIAECFFYNTVKSGVFIKNNCGSGLSGSSVAYTVPSGKYVSNSQERADNLAQSEVNNNGQAYANTNGICIYNSIARTGAFTKNNCGQNGDGSVVNYTQGAGAVTSAVSQSDADALGLAKFNADGQAYANAYGGCSVGFSYEYFFNASTRQLSLDVMASGTAHNGATLYFTVNFIRTSGVGGSVAQTVVLSAGQTSKLIPISLPAKSIVSVTLDQIVRN